LVLQQLATVQGAAEAAAAMAVTALPALAAARLAAEGVAATGRDTETVVVKRVIEGGHHQSPRRVTERRKQAAMAE
jgi:ABC-type xylose transport system substrate-binding protein